MSEVHIYAPKAEKVWIARSYCPTCKKPRFFLQVLYPWFGLNETCLKCGERWGDKEMLERPFCRGWRQDSVKRAKKLYRRFNCGKKLKERKGKEGKEEVVAL